VQRQKMAAGQNESPETAWKGYGGRKCPPRIRMRM
jgi:hypothetical protein